MIFNPTPRISIQPLADGGECLVIDDALREPEKLVALAVKYRGEFQWSPANAFPGPELRMPEGFTAALDAFFAQHARRRLGGRRTLRAWSRLSMVNLPPERLAPRQWICHRDRMELEPGRCVAACVLYLFHDPALGGTSFYRPLRTPLDTALMVQDSGRLGGADFAARYGISPGYPVADNGWFARVATVPARFNRLIIYDGMQFHAGQIDRPDLLDDDPTRGRLTLNGFFTCRAAIG